MTLKDCTKAELLWIIDRLRNRGLYRLDTIIAIALNDLEYQREQKKLDEADRLNEESARLNPSAKVQKIRDMSFNNHGLYFDLQLHTSVYNAHFGTFGNKQYIIFQQTNDIILHIYTKIVLPNQNILFNFGLSYC